MRGDTRRQISIASLFLLTTTLLACADTGNTDPTADALETDSCPASTFYPDVTTCDACAFAVRGAPVDLERGCADMSPAGGSTLVACLAPDDMPVGEATDCRVVPGIGEIVLFHTSAAIAERFEPCAVGRPPCAP